MFRKRKLLLFSPLAVIFLLIFIFPPQRLLGVKSALISFFRAPLRIAYRTQLSLVHAGKIFNFYSEYSRMNDEISRLKLAANEARELRLENERLCAILDLKPIPNLSYFSARVIGKEPTNWLNTLIIDKGSNHGVFINQPVMKLSGLVGKVIEVNAASAKVLLISDVNSRVVVILQRTRQEAMLEGIGTGFCRIKYLPVDADVTLGDTIVSAGVGGVYPKGLVIGTVESIRIERGGIYKSCIVKPETPLEGVEEVLCLKLNSGQ